MRRCENVIVGYETAAAELFAGLEEHGHPGELMGTRVVAAHNALLVGRDGILVAALQRQSFWTVASCWTARGRCCCCRRIAGPARGRWRSALWAWRCTASS